MQDSPPAAGRFSDIIPFRCSAIPAEHFYRIGNKVSYTRKSPQMPLHSGTLFRFSFACPYLTAFFISFRKKSSGIISDPRAFSYQNNKLNRYHLLSSRLYCRLWNYTKSYLSARGLYRRWRITLRPEDSICNCQNIY